MNLPILDISQKWNHVRWQPFMIGFFHLAERFQDSTMLWHIISCFIVKPKPGAVAPVIISSPQKAEEGRLIEPESSRPACGT
jgi:hypothetical protein